jgi:sugar phosphate isomerase/epimerase
VTVLWICPLWGLQGPTLASRLSRVKDAGFDGVEGGIPVDAAERAAFVKLLRELDLRLVAQQWTTGADPKEHARSFEEQYRRGVELEPLFVNSHTGRDIFTLPENLVVFEAARRLEEHAGVRVMHEIHRGRPTFSVPSTMALLDALPDLRLTADFSHWCCVHESLLEDQAREVTRAIQRVGHLHARIGHAEGPQVPDPRAPLWARELAAHLQWWQAVVDRARGAGESVLSICPEFGPSPYMTIQPESGAAIADQWTVNRWVKDFLRGRLVI